MPRIFAQLLLASGKLRSHDSTSVVLTSERRMLPQCGMTHLFKYALYVVFVEWLRQMFSLLSSRSNPATDLRADSASAYWQTVPITLLR